VWDDDGDFLLIEAAYALPKWLTPETSMNRVWIRAGHLHIIPPPSKVRPELPAFPTIKQAIGILESSSMDALSKSSSASAKGKAVESCSSSSSSRTVVTASVPAAWTMASPKVQAALKARLGDLPGSALEERVAVEAYLPLRVAAIIYKDPHFIAFIVEAFLDRWGNMLAPNFLMCSSNNKLVAPIICSETVVMFSQIHAYFCVLLLLSYF
jgi:hypothetical protein